MSDTRPPMGIWSLVRSVWGDGFCDAVQEECDTLEDRCHCMEIICRRANIDASCMRLEQMADAVRKVAETLKARCDPT